jgi:hypothetical protein
MLLALTNTSNAATITVTTNKPDIKGGDGKCSLIEAVVNANDHAATHADCAAGDGNDTIVLPTSAIIKFTSSTYENGLLPAVTSSITIEGNRSKLTRKRKRSIFSLGGAGSSGNLVLNNVLVTGFGAGGALINNGSLTIRNSVIYGNMGGAVNNGVDAVLSIENSTIKGNSAFRGAGIYNDGGTVSISNSTISENKATQSGGAIYNRVGYLYITHSTISGNTVTGNKKFASSSFGGAISAYNSYSDRSGSIVIFNSDISGNTVIGSPHDKYNPAGFAIGGGIFAYRTRVEIFFSTISGNQALGAKGGRALGGGIYNYGELFQIFSSTISGNAAIGGKNANGQAGGISNFGTFDLANSTVSGNSAGSKSGGKGYGGGIQNFRYFTVGSSTVTGNTATVAGGISNVGIGGVTGGGNHSFTKLHFLGSIVSGNQADDAPEIRSDVSNNYRLVYDDGFNVIGVNGDAGVVGFTPEIVDVVPAAGVTIDKIISPLADNGGPTLTHALVDGSPALSLVPLDACPPEDQRLVFRPQGGPLCDAGSFER